MERLYKINLFDPKSYDVFIKNLDKLSKSLDSQEFMDFIADKSMRELEDITNKKIRTIPDNDVTSYRYNHKAKTGKNYVEISNDTMADLSNLSEETRANYPNGLSIAKIVEFGTGILGEDNEEFNWKTQMNPDRDYSKGWYYEKNGKIYWTRGMKGKFIYHGLLKKVKNKFPEWLSEYIDKV